MPPPPPGAQGLVARTLNPGDDRRPRLCPLALTIEAPRRPAAGLVVQIVRLPRRDRGRLQADDIVVDAPITINGWSPRNNSRRFAGQVRCARPSPSRSTPFRSGSRRRSASGLSPTWPSVRITSPVVTHPSMALRKLRGPADRHDPGLRLGGGNAVDACGINGHHGQRQILSTSADENRVLVAPWVAQMTEIVQALTGTGRSTRSPKPVAGKTGTTRTAGSSASRAG